MLMKILGQTSEVPQVDDVQTAAAAAVAAAAVAPEGFVSHAGVEVHACTFRFNQTQGAALCEPLSRKHTHYRLGTTRKLRGR